MGGRVIVTLAAYQADMKAQGVSSRDHVAFTCPMCRTVQSMALLAQAGVPQDKLEAQVGFSCVGRVLGSGPASADRTPGKPDGVGCDWSLGGLLSLHEVEVDMGDGKPHRPTFALATPQQAVILEKLVLAGMALPGGKAA